MAQLSEAPTATSELLLATGFQLESTELTVTVNGTPAVWVYSVPVFPEGEPGNAVWFGRRICSFTALFDTTLNGSEMLGDIMGGV